MMVPFLDLTLDRRLLWFISGEEPVESIWKEAIGQNHLPIPSEQTYPDWNPPVEVLDNISHRLAG